MAVPAIFWESEINRLYRSIKLLEIGAGTTEIRKIIISGELLRNSMNSEDVWTTPTVFRSDLFEGQNILVTGGGSGIGRAVSVLAARLGANVIICGRTSEKLERVSEEAREHGFCTYSR
jgi:FlaA1/EpsC-like NDP-sugar epimerase